MPPLKSPSLRSRRQRHVFVLPFLLLGLFLILNHCAEPREPLDHAMLVDHEQWTPVATDQDPYTTRRPDKIECPPKEGFGFEIFNDEPTFQVNTLKCNYITVQQPLPIPLYKGDQLHLRLWYFSLSSFEATEAFVALRMGGEEIWSKTLPLPARSNLEYPTLTLTRDIPKGAEVLFHVDNHGANTWHLIEWSASRQIP